MSKKVLISYFSHGGENLVDDEIVDLGNEGNTMKVAKSLQKALISYGIVAPCFEIKPIMDYPFSYEETNKRSHEEYETGARPLIFEGPDNFEKYDLIFLGYPNWWGTCPAPVLSFLQGHNFKNKLVIPFVTHGGQIFMSSIDEIKKEIPQTNVVEGFAVSAVFLNSADIVIAKWLSANQELLK